ncbi:aspartate 1-decarboxylase [candidate division KSB1 bacterium]|nr:aspartate 1-decarboxylase [candidate division KSB1 bacterium]RQW07360.1 MAG: aspartate 1-decarboxylase [candidate division KSB1 bacterium]
MLITVMKSKIHNATVTQANLHYEGSITIDRDLMQQAHIFHGERVQIVNLANGERLETYTIPGEPGSGIIGINGPAALKCKIGDKVHIISYALLEPTRIDAFQATVLFLTHGNSIKENGLEKQDRE